MADIDRYRPDDRRQVEALYRRVFGPDAALASQLRWDWQYRLNPHTAPGRPLIWLARESQAIVGQYAAMPVRLWVAGKEVDAAWGMDVMVAPERQRQGLGESSSGRGIGTSGPRSAWGCRTRRTGCSRSCGGPTWAPSPAW